MHYLDTSFITPLLLTEPTSADVEAYVGKLPAGSLYISHWTALELASVVAREVRMKRLTEAGARAVLAEFDKIVSDSLNLLMPTVAISASPASTSSALPLAFAAATRSIWRSRRTLVPRRS